MGSSVHRGGAIVGECSAVRASNPFVPCLGGSILSAAVTLETLREAQFIIATDWFQHYRDKVLK